MARGAKTGGRSRGTPNKTTALLKDAILLAAENAGGEGGIVGYLQKQASENPQSFLPLLGKVLPLTVAGDPDAPLEVLVRAKQDAQRFRSGIASVASRKGTDKADRVTLN